MRSSSRILSLIAVIILTSVLAFSIIPTDTWWIRWLDFPRVQFLVVLLVSLGLYLILGGWRSLLGKAITVIAAIVFLYQGLGITPFVFPTSEAKAAVCGSMKSFVVIVANVQKDNRLEKRFFELVDQTNPDILLVLETDDWWDRELRALKAVFAHQHQKIPERQEFYGMHLLSKFELMDPEVKTYVSVDTPTIVTGIKITVSDTVTFIGIHPRPPNVDRQPSTQRDANLVAAALDARQAAHPVVIAGDFNATPWDRTTLLTLRLAGLSDPRRAYGLVPTYSANNPVMAWPLDHIVYQRGLSLEQFGRLPPFGSDHYAVFAKFCLSENDVSPKKVYAVSNSDLEEASQTLRKAKAMN